MIYRAGDRLGLMQQTSDRYRTLRAGPKEILTGWEHVLHEVTHYVVAMGRPPRPMQDFGFGFRTFGQELDMLLKNRLDPHNEHEGKLRLMRHEVKTCGYELVLAQSLGLTVSALALARSLVTGTLVQLELS